MTLTIRPLTANDKPVWHELWQGYLTYYRTTITAEVTELTWNRLMDADFAIHGLGAVNAEGKLIGIVHYLFHPVTWSAEPRCYLEDLFTAEQARNTGAGRALIQAVAEAARDKGASELYWLTEDHNKRAQHLYNKVADKTVFIKYRKALR